MDSSPFEEKPAIADPFQLPRSGGLFSRFNEDSGRKHTLKMQPNYDILAPAGSPSNSHFSEANIYPTVIESADLSNVSLRTDLHSTRYELQTLREERQLELLRHEQEIRTLEGKLEDHAKRIDTVEAEKRFLFDKEDELKASLKKNMETAKCRKQDFERQIRRLKSENSEFKDLINDTQEEIASERREHRRRVEEYETRIKAEDRMIEELRNTLESTTDTLQDNQDKLVAKDTYIQDLETEILRLKTQTGDLDTLKLLKKELNEQVNHIKSLEGSNRRQSTELKHLRESLKSLDVMEEEKRSLERKLIVVDELRSELSRAQLTVSVLQDEKNAWESYFRSENLEFDTPEALAKALLEERLERAALLERSGRLNPEIVEKDRVIIELQSSLETIKDELDHLKNTIQKDVKSRERLERQRTLALKEAQFLREQLKSFTTEETIHMQGNFDQQKSDRIQELELLLEAYKNEVEELKAAVNVIQKVSPNAGHKRCVDRVDDDRVGQLFRRNRQLQDDFAKLERKYTMSKNETEALRFQMSSMENTSARVLQLKDNPTSREQAVKLSHLTSLQQENAALLAQLDGRTDKVGKVVPRSTLENARIEIKNMEKVVAEKEKRMTRLKEIWSTKSMELREAVYSLLGWKFDFMPNGRVKVTHMFAGNEDQSIEFDGEKGTMKVSGGPDSLFHKEIRNNCSFWMARQSIPCLLASVLIEQYEKTTRAQM